MPKTRRSSFEKKNQGGDCKGVATQDYGAMRVAEGFDLELTPSQGVFIVLRIGTQRKFRLPLEHVVVFFADIGVSLDQVELVERGGASKDDKALLWNLMNALKQRRL